MKSCNRRGSLLLHACWCIGCGALCWLALAPAQAQLANVFPSQLKPDAREIDYELDTISRSVNAQGALKCDESRLVPYAGEVVPFKRGARVDSAFRPHLLAFERVVSELARSVYGRGPERLRHLGAYSCRRVRGLPMWLSEHALGNAIDIAAFEFGPAGQVPAAKVPAGLEGAFEVTVLRHWIARSPADQIHSRFLHELARRLVARHDMFRSLIGPKANGHRNHFHLDMGQVRAVEL